jgi:outer membrane protein TolC
MKISINQQITAAELQLANARGHVSILQDRLRQRKADPIMVEMAEAKLPDLEAILKTLRWLKTNEEKIKNILK